MNERERKPEQSFSDMVSSSIRDNIKRTAKHGIGAGVAMAVLAGVFFLKGSLGGTTVSLILAVDAFVKSIAELMKAKAMADGYNRNERSLLTVHGMNGSERSVEARLNEQYQAGKLLASEVDTAFKFFLFPDCVVIVERTGVTVIAEQGLCWAYHEKNRKRKTGYLVHFYTADEKITFNVAYVAKRKLLMEQLERHYGMRAGYDERLKILVKTDREEFVREMEEYKRK